MTRMRSTLVTGATTPLGALVCKQLQQRRIAVLAIGQEPDYQAAALLHPDIAYQHVDLTRPRDLHDLLFSETKARQVDTIFHLATHRRLNAGGHEAHALNVEAVRLLLSHSAAHPTVERVIYRSFADVYRVDHHLPSIVAEDHPVDHAAAHQHNWLRDRIEADSLACAQMGMGAVAVMVLRCAEVFSADMGSQIFDYLQSRVCLQAAGFDPLINLLSLEDACAALLAAGDCGEAGVYNIAGLDTLPLSRCIRTAGRHSIPIPGPLLAPLYRLRRRLLHSDFSASLNWQRLHFPAILDGSKAARVLGYRPRCSALPR